MSLQGTTLLRRCGITSLKSLIGHTKAASGAGALIKTVIALNQRILPPLANCFEPSPVFAETATSLYPLLRGEIRPPQEILRAGVSGMGFGGINSHLALASGDAPSPKLMPAIREQKLLADYQRTELFVFSAPTVEELLGRVQAAEGLAQNICEGERLDLAVHLATLYGHNTTCGPVRVAIMAESPEMLQERLAKIAHILRTSPPKGQQTFFDLRAGICIGNDVQSHRVGFLFPGQGSQKINMGHQLVQRHDWAEDIVKAMEKALGWPEGKQLTDFIFRPTERALDQSQVKGWQEQLKQTEIAQPALCLASMLGLEQLARLGIKPDAVGGHSLGELTAFYAAGAYSREELINFATLRGQAMAPGQGHTGGAAGTMASLACSAVQAQAVLDAVQGYAVVANKNSASQTVISGEPSCIQQACLYAKEQGIRGVLLPVANAFHSRFVSSAAQVLADSRLLPAQPKQLTTALFSGLQGEKVDMDCELRRHFSDQVISPVDFISLVQEMSKECDLLLEVGPGRVLTGLARSIIVKKNEGEGGDGPICFPLETKSEQDRDLNLFLAAYFVRGGTINWHALYEDRLVRPFTLADDRLFLANPCERPFPEHFPEQKEQSLSLPSYRSSGRGGGSDTDRVLADAAGLSEDELAVYLEQRSQFIGGLIRVDLDNMAPSLSALKPIFTPPFTDLPEKKDSNVDESADLLFALIEERTGFPPESLSMNLRLLDDLNLDSIKASELIAEAANRSGISAAKLNVSEYANATLQEVAALLDREPEQDKDIIENGSSRYPGWARDFTLQYLPQPLSSEYADEQSEQSWLHREEAVLILFESAEQHIAEQLEVVLQRFLAEASAKISVEFLAKVELVSFAEARQGVSSLLDRFTSVIALLPRQKSSEGNFFDQQTLVKQVTRLHTIFSPAYHRPGLGNQSLTVAQFGDGFFGDGPVPANINRCSAKALAASLHLEKPDLKVRVLDFSPQISQDQLCEYIMVELSTAESYAAVGYAADQIRRVPTPVLRHVAVDKPRPIRWSPKDVVLATGGAKGITAECVLAFARATGVQLALVGSSSPAMHNEQQDEILYTLKRANEAGLSAHYYQCDVTDAEAVKRLVHQVENEQGTITGVIHGSALNRPGELDTVPVEQALEEISPKVIGAMNLCAALQDHPPQLFIAFSSLIGISGMQKNGWYGFSNEALHLFLQQYGETEPRITTLSIAFSIWDEVGMGSRMGSTSWLSKIGVAALTVQQGTSRFLQLAIHDPVANQVIVTARSYGLDTFLPHGRALPQGLRFIDRVLDYQPGIEIISRTRLTLEDDPYIKDHCWRGTYLFPLVFGLEAMAQAVRAVTGNTCFDAVCIEDVELARPIVLPEDIGAEIEIHALVLEQDNLEDAPQVQVQIRTEQTDFRVDHFSATFVLRDACSPVRHDLPEALSPLDLVPERDLYKEGLLFQGPLYQMIQQVFHLSSEGCLFSTASSVEPVDSSGQTWMLGNPFSRDALLQSGQLPIPRDLCLPARIQRIERFPAISRTDEPIFGKALIEEHTEKYIYGTVTAFNEQGQVLERIIGYRAQIVEHRRESPTAEDLVYPGHRDRRILRRELKQREALLPTHCTLPKLSSDFIPGLQHIGKDERRKKELPFIRNALTPLLRASDTRIEISWSQAGKPSLAIPADAGVYFSLTHNEGTVICMAGRGLQGCDLEAVSSRSKEEWQDLLGEKSEALLVHLIKQGDSLHRAGTRLWSAYEAAFKALTTCPDPSMISVVQKKDDSVLFTYQNNSSSCYILTFPVWLTLRGERMLAVVVQEEHLNNAISERVPVSGNTDAWPDRVGSFTHEFTTTFFGGEGAEREGLFY
ncbi:SDR family NAD(P)-dependent oxidoreductase [Desulfobulbus sp. US4]|nr:SDR family NAD(P)-dependent oxidoreductase [Desulfobulbus sp. US4]